MIERVAVALYLLSMGLLSRRAEELIVQLRRRGQLSPSAAAAAQELEHALLLQFTSEEAQGFVRSIVREVARKAVAKHLQPDPETGKWAG